MKTIQRKLLLQDSLYSDSDYMDCKGGENMEMIIDNWYIILALLALLVVVGLTIVKFLGLPTNSQVTKIKAWLLQAVIEAEKELGSGTGKLKLSTVYDMFVQRFPMTANFISFETFSSYVDLALEEMRKMLETNENIKQIVEQGE